MKETIGVYESFASEILKLKLLKQNILVCKSAICIFVYSNISYSPILCSKCSCESTQMYLVCVCECVCLLGL